MLGKCLEDVPLESGHGSIGCFLAKTAEVSKFSKCARLKPCMFDFVPLGKEQPQVFSSHFFFLNHYQKHSMCLQFYYGTCQSIQAFGLEFLKLQGDIWNVFLRLSRPKHAAFHFTLIRTQNFTEWTNESCCSFVHPKRKKDWNSSAAVGPELQQLK